MGSKSTISRFERLFIEIFSLTSSIMNFFAPRHRLPFARASCFHRWLPLPLHKLILHLLARAVEIDRMLRICLMRLVAC